MNLRLAAAIALGLVAGGIAAMSLVTGSSNPGTGAQQTSTGKALIGGPFSLVDQTGKRVTDKDFAGRPMLVYFGYTSCPDICPAGLQVISAALDKLGPKANTLTPVFITVDPERDTPEVMAAYIKSFHPHLTGLTGSRADVDAVTKTYRVYAKKVPDDANPANYSMDHSSFMYLMSGTGEFLRHFPSTIGVDQLADALGKAL